jgi:hypothetical protein
MRKIRYRVRLRISWRGWQRQAEPSQLADGVGAGVVAIGKLRLPLPPGCCRYREISRNRHGWFLACGPGLSRHAESLYNPEHQTALVNRRAEWL